jgi:hypothetical protein
LRNGSKASGQRSRAWAQGRAATEQVHGTYSKAAKQRLSYCGWCWLLPQMPKRVLAFGIAHLPAVRHPTKPAEPFRTTQTSWGGQGGRAQLLLGPVYCPAKEAMPGPCFMLHNSKTSHSNKPQAGGGYCPPVKKNAPRWPSFQAACLHVLEVSSDVRTWPSNFPFIP